MPNVTGVKTSGSDRESQGRGSDVAIHVVVTGGDPALGDAIASLLHEAGFAANVAVVTNSRTSQSSAQSLQLDGFTVPLTRGEFALLHLLSRPRGMWRTTSELASALGRTDAAGQTLVWKYISRLKTKLSDGSMTLEHVRNVGYRLR